MTQNQKTILNLLTKRELAQMAVTLCVICTMWGHLNAKVESLHEDMLLVKTILLRPHAENKSLSEPLTRNGVTLKVSEEVVSKNTNSPLNSVYSLCLRYPGSCAKSDSSLAAIGIECYDQKRVMWRARDGPA